MKKIIFFLILISIMISNIPIVSAFVGDGDTVVSYVEGSFDSQVIKYSVESHISSRWAQLRWATFGFKLFLMSKDRTQFIGESNKDPQQNYSYKNQLNQPVPAGILYKRIDTSDAEPGTVVVSELTITIPEIKRVLDIPDELQKTGFCLKLEPVISVLKGQDYDNTLGYKSCTVYQEPVELNAAQTGTYFGLQFSNTAIGDMIDRQKYVDFAPIIKDYTVKINKSWWGVTNQGVAVQLCPNEVITQNVSIGDSYTTTVTNNKTFSNYPDYDYKTNGISWSGGYTYTDELSSASRTVTLDSNNKEVWIRFKYQQKPPVPTSKPKLGIDASPKSVKVNETYSIIDGCIASNLGTKISKWTVKEEFTPKGSSTKTLVKSYTDLTTASTFFTNYSKSATGTYTYTVTACTDNATPTAQTTTGSASVDVIVDEVPPPVPTNKPPIASIDSVQYVTAGEDITIDGSGSWDSDGTIINYSWSLPSVGQSITGSKGTTWFTSSGTQTVGLTVTDDGGLTDSTTRKITVYQGNPSAVITYSGTLKENRKITLSSESSRSPKHFPIDHTKDVWVITAVTGQTSAIKYRGSLNGQMKLETMFKVAGDYKVQLTVTNSQNLTHTTETILHIGTDLLPVADFGSPAQVLRDNRDSLNVAYAVATITCTSNSPDGDIIGHRVWSYKYDTDNDGLLSDEVPVIISDANNSSINIVTYNVGMYGVSLDIEESIPDDETLKEYLLPTDIKRSTISSW